MGNKILFVDDDEMWRKRVTASFAVVGHEVVTACDASEAMDLAEQVHPGLAILDLDLNGEDGVMLLKFLKRNHPKLPVLMFTGMEHDEAATEKALKLGAAACLPKTNIEDLIAAAGAYL